MRISNKTFGVRKTVLKSEEANKKYFLAFEGVQTEVIYFDGVCINKEELNISPSIELVPLLRHYPHIGWSNPLKIFERVKSCLNNLSHSQRNVYSFVNAITDYFCENAKKITNNDDREILLDIIEKIFYTKFDLKLDDNIDFSDEDLILKIITIFVTISQNYMVENIPNFIEAQFQTYDSNFDRVCLIVDRDKNSFTNSQYEKLLEKCKEINFDLYISNPCFEFWLLLHFDEVNELDFNKMKDNKKDIIIINEFGKVEKITYAEDQLKTIFPNYKKNSFDFNILKKRIPKAILNANKFETDIERMKDSIGSNIGKLFEALQDEDNC